MAGDCRVIVFIEDVADCARGLWVAGASGYFFVGESLATRDLASDGEDFFGESLIHNNLYLARIFLISKISEFP